MKICNKTGNGICLNCPNYFLIAMVMFVEKMLRCCWIVSKKLLTPIGLTSKNRFLQILALYKTTNGDFTN